MLPQDFDLESLLQRLREGEDSALGPLFDHFRERLWRMVRFRLDPRLEARLDPDDVLQEAFLDANKRLDAWRKDSEKSFFIWLRLIVGQTMTDLHRRHIGARKRDAGREVSLHAGAGPSAPSLVLSKQLLASLTSPSNAAIRAEARTQFEEFLEQMESIDREILTLRHFEELSNSEVCEILGLKPAAASNRYVRALMRLRKFVEESGGDY
ncbi:MAG: RNA polymerase subunit sigma [Planctomycetota bacterium]|nr:MAG: RNA polymerase subunit sigma [Planctomycetota bacterium]